LASFAGLVKLESTGLLQNVEFNVREDESDIAIGMAWVHSIQTGPGPFIDVHIMKFSPP
jgi:hypothetical protein